jgi:ADP-dependent NAD(P)H-hydrate dehydratase / NAD(P)H-hydrate epimerase
MGQEVLSAAEMARADALAVAQGIPGLVLMENAGSAVAEEALRIATDKSGLIVVICGPGNNGGDGFVAARLLREQGRRVRVGLLSDPAALKGDAAAMASRWGGAVEAATTATLAGASLIIDAMFGAGLSRPLEGLAAHMCAAINASGKPVLAIDVPSGLDGTTGRANGPVVQATSVVTFFRLKPGHLLLPGRSLCGEVRLADIGIPARVLDDIAPKAFANRPPLWRDDVPRPNLESHKYRRGHAVVISGPAERTGAARLGARGALRAGAGLVTLVGSAMATAINAAHVTAVMVKAAGGDDAIAEVLADRRYNGVLIGPGAGVGAATATTVLRVLASGAAVVLDADALTSFAAPDQTNPARPAALGFVARGPPPVPTQASLFDAIKTRAAPVVLTPHAGEFKRLFGDLPGSKLDCARSAARTSGGVVVLKGADTVIAAPDGRAAINDNAPPWLATAGAGDVLAGFVLGLLAQRMAAFEAACAAVWLHGACADEFGVGLIAEDLPEVLPRVLRQLMAAPADPLPARPPQPD